MELHRALKGRMEPLRCLQTTYYPAVFLLLLWYFETFGPNLKVLNSPRFHNKFFSQAPNEVAFVVHDRQLVKLCALRNTMYLTLCQQSGLHGIASNNNNSNYFF